MHLCGRALASGARSLMVPRGPNGCKTGRNSSCMQQFARYVCVKMLEFITASSLQPWLWQACSVPHSSLPHDRQLIASLSQRPKRWRQLEKATRRRE